MKKMLTPSDLQTSTVAQDVSGKYDWKKQIYQYDVCKFGTGGSTRQGTSSCSGSTNIPWQDDNNSDSYSD